ncbi:MAG: SWIM zinc finger family protein [Actinomycetota bacterium]|nr:SWIM zinc finger family protein [Actinomycetota bacterium]
MDTKSVAETATKAIRDRAGRGMRLYRAGAVVRHGDALVVKGTRRAYTVFVKDGEEPRCDCPDFAERCRDAGHACKHGYAAVVFEARERCGRGVRS